MEVKRVVRMKNGKYAIQEGCEDTDHDTIHWEFENFHTPTDKWERLLFNTEHDANQHIQKWINENQISEICMEVYINEEK